MEENQLSPEDQNVQEMLDTRLTVATQEFANILAKHGATVEVLAAVMNRWIDSLPPLPEGAACQQGCHYCCHMGQEASIPEILILFNELKAATTPEGLEFFKSRVTDMAAHGETEKQDWWRQSQTPCPFLDGGGCLIYGIRPFSCRAYHSADAVICKQGFDDRAEVQVPCFPLFRKFTGLHALAFIQGAAAHGLKSHGVAMVKALALMFRDETAGDRWLAGEDVFADCKFV